MPREDTVSLLHRIGEKLGLGDKKEDEVDLQTVTRALSIRQPYAEQIMRGDKVVEYRSQRTKLRERVYVYASNSPASGEAFEAMGAGMDDFPRGVLVGTVEVVDCTGEPGDYEWHLRYPMRLPKPMKPTVKPQPVWFRPFGTREQVGVAGRASGCEPCAGVEVTVSEPSISIDEFMRALRKLRADPPMYVPGVWYTTQKEHWLGWLAEYNAPGAYGRRTHSGRDAKFAYNHIVCYGMLEWLARAAGVDGQQVEAGRVEAEPFEQQQKCAVFRRHVPWSDIYAALW